MYDMYIYMIYSFMQYKDTEPAVYGQNTFLCAVCIRSAMMAQDFIVEHCMNIDIDLHIFINICIYVYICLSFS